MEKIAEPWRPYRSAGAWYLWRRADTGYAVVACQSKSNAKQFEANGRRSAVDALPPEFRDRIANLDFAVEEMGAA